MKPGVLFISILLSSCTSDFGNRVQGDKLNVYYVDEGDRLLAEQVALYWKENDLMTGREQDVQLITEEGGFELRLIANELESVKDMSVEERSILLQLQKDLTEKIGRKKNYFQIIICNDRFEPLFNINE